MLGRAAAQLGTPQLGTPQVVNRLMPFRSKALEACRLPCVSHLAPARATAYLLENPPVPGWLAFHLELEVLTQLVSVSRYTRYLYSFFAQEGILGRVTACGYLKDLYLLARENANLAVQILPVHLRLRERRDELLAAYYPEELVDWGFKSSGYEVTVAQIRQLERQLEGSDTGDSDR